MSVSQGLLPFKVESEDHPTRLTSRAGIPLLVEMLRALRVHQDVRDLFDAPRASNGYTPESFVETFVAAFASGAKSVDDVAHLATDRGLAALLRRDRFPSASALHRFLEGFHILPRRQGGIAGQAVVPDESPMLAALDEVVRRVTARVLAGKKHPSLTIDLDATIIESHKEEALAHYDSGRGYQPWVAYCPEAGLVVTDEFRDGNVPAGFNARAQVQKAFAALPASARKHSQLYFRADSALYDREALNWMDRKNIWFAVTADMSPELRARIDSLTESDWVPLRKPEVYGLKDTNCQIAEVEFHSTESSTSKNVRPFRTFVIRKFEEQGRLFETDDQKVWYLAMVTNRTDLDPTQAWWWHKQKCGTVELVHDQIKNDLAAGVMPSGRFQVNAAWFRLNVLAFNLMAALKQVGLPDAMGLMRPASLRYRLMNLAGRLVSRSGSLILKLPLIPGLLDLYRSCRSRILATQQRLHLATA